MSESKKDQITLYIEKQGFKEGDSLVLQKTYLKNRTIYIIGTLAYKWKKWRLLNTIPLSHAYTPIERKSTFTISAPALVESLRYPNEKDKKLILINKIR